MLSLNINSGEKPVRILCLGAHCDDIEIGCGGTLLSMRAQMRQVEFHWVIFTSGQDRVTEARRAAELIAGDDVVFEVHDFPNGHLPYHGSEVKQRFEDIKSRLNPDIIFTHHTLDIHQDHKCIGELTWSTFRDHLIFEYEIPKYDGDLVAPNTFFPISEQVVQEKVRIILSTFRSQADQQWFDEDTFRGLMRIRGVEANSPTRFAEGFHCRKLLIATMATSYSRIKLEN